MFKLLISGASGKMGQKVLSALKGDNDLLPTCGVSIEEDFSNPNFPIYKSFLDVKEKVDVIIDFSSAVVVDELLSFAVNTKTPVVICSTGLSEKQIENINNASKNIAIFRSANMSLGVNVLIKAVELVTKALGGFDVEIIEKHHNQKVDAPSGTALMLADAVKKVLPENYYVYGREGVTGKRDKKEIGIHAIRGGNIVGEHDVIYAGENETVTLSHLASDRSVFANGAIAAAKFLVMKKKGLYNMNDLLSE